MKAVAIVKKLRDIGMSNGELKKAARVSRVVLKNL